MEAEAHNLSVAAHAGQILSGHLHSVVNVNSELTPVKLSRIILSALDIFEIGRPFTVKNCFEDSAWNLMNRSQKGAQQKSWRKSRNTRIRLARRKLAKLPSTPREHNNTIYEERKGGDNMQDYDSDLVAPVPEDIYRELYSNYTDKEIEEEIDAWDKDC